MAIFKSSSLVSYPRNHPLLDFKTNPDFGDAWVLIDYNEETKLLDVFFQKASEVSITWDTLQEAMNMLSLLFPKEKRGRQWTYQLKQLAEIQMLFDIREFTNYQISKTAIEAYLTTYNHPLPPIRRVPMQTKLFPDHVTPYEAQQVGVRWMLPKARFCNNDDTGLGKTMQTITTIAKWFELGWVDCVVVVVRDSLLHHWKDEFISFAPQFTSQDFALVGYKNRDQLRTVGRTHKVVLVAMGGLAQGLYDAKASKPKYKSKKKVSLANVRWTEDAVPLKEYWGRKSMCLVVDEVHNFNRMSSTRTKALLSIRNQFDYRATLSASLSMTKYEGHFPIYKLLGDGVIPMTETAFSMFVAQTMGDRFSQFTISEYDMQAVQKCTTYFQQFTIKRLKKDQADMKATQLIIPRKLMLDEDRQAMYKILQEQETARLDKRSGEISYRQSFPLSLACLDNAELLEGKILPEDKKLYRMVSNWHLGKDNKLAYCTERLEELIGQQGLKVIIADHHPETLNYLYEHFEHYNPLIVHGQIPGRTRESDEQKRKLFNDPKSPHKLFLGSSLIIGEGWNLHHACHNMIIYTCPASTKLRQIVDRTHRISSEQDTVVEILVHLGTYDQLRYQKAVARMKLNDSLLKEGDVTTNLAELTKLFEGAYSSEQHIQKV